MPKDSPENTRIPLLNVRLVMWTALFGTVTQLALSVARHVFPGLPASLILFGHMMISATAGYLYGLLLGKSYGRGALGGGIAGGLSVVPACAVSVLLGDSDGILVTTATLISILTGAVGGCFGHMGAIMRKLGL